jgi:hypothetical protein
MLKIVLLVTTLTLLISVPAFAEHTRACAGRLKWRSVSRPELPAANT